MKTERRHELESNTLAKGINEWGDKLRPYSSAILAVVALMLGLYVAASLWNSYQANRDSAAWDDYQLAVFQGDSEMRQLQRFANSEDHQGTEMQEWALVGWADRQLLAAARGYLANRDDAKERLTNIEGIYEQFAESGSNPEVRNRSRLGLARVSEMQNKLDEARKHYALVEGALATIAAERIKQLESKDAQEVSKWLATADLPKPKPAPGPGIPGQRPGFEATPPAADSGAPLSFDSPQSLEEILGDIAPSEDGGRYGDESKPAETTPADAVPAETSAEPAASTELPGGQAATNEPAATQPPATAEPAAEQPAAEEAAEQPEEQPAEEAAQPPADNAAAPAQQ